MGHEVAAALSAQRRATLEQLRTLTAPDWDCPCLPPWRVREVVAHLVTTDEAAASGRLLGVLRTHDRAALERWNDRAVAQLAELAPDELLDRLEHSGARVQRIAARLPRPLFRLRLRTPVGRQRLRLIACRRVLDEWVHTVDIARAVGAEVVVPPGVSDALAAGVLESLPLVTLPRLAERAGVVRLVVETGTPRDPHGPRRVWGIDLARRQYGARVTARPDATVRLHASVLALLSEGRLTPPVAPPAVVVDGDDALAGRLLEGLRP